MFTSSLTQKKLSRVQIPDAVPHALRQGAEEGANRIAEAVELAGAKVAKGAGQASGRASELTGQIKGRATNAQAGMKRPKLSLKVKRSGGKGGKLAAGSDALLKAQLVKTSRELAHESSDLNAAVDSLNSIIKSNRKAAARAKGRTRMLGGLAIGAALMYHLDAEHGQERRAATARRLTGMFRGQLNPPAGAR